jgi:hypothetical protein
MAGIRIPGVSSSPKVRTSVLKPPHLSTGGGRNYNRDRNTVMRPPRLMPLPTPTRMYQKQPASDAPMGAGFGQTAATGES